MNDWGLALEHMPQSPAQLGVGQEQWVCAPPRKLFRGQDRGLRPEVHGGSRHLATRVAGAIPLLSCVDR